RASAEEALRQADAERIYQERLSDLRQHLVLARLARSEGETQMTQSEAKPNPEALRRAQDHFDTAKAEAEQAGPIARELNREQELTEARQLRDSIEKRKTDRERLAQFLPARDAALLHLTGVTQREQNRSTALFRGKARAALDIAPPPGSPHLTKR